MARIYLQADDEKIWRLRKWDILGYSGGPPETYWTTSNGCGGTRDFIECRGD